MICNRGEERSRIGSMMSICLTWFPKRVLGPIYTIICSFYKNVGGVTWRASNFEGLAGVAHRRRWGWIIVLSFFHLQSFQRCFHLFRMSFRSTFFHPSILLHTFYHQTKCMFLDHSYSDPLIPLHTCLH